jgi:transcriptional regulator with XRE-family HTH domain
MIEKGERSPSLALAAQLSKVTGIPIDEFVGAREAAQ